MIATEKTLDVSNSQACFIVEALPSLRMIARPTEWDSGNRFKVNEVHKLPVPLYDSENLIRFSIIEKDEELAPDWINIRAPRSNQPFIEVKCTHVPLKSTYEFELTASDYKLHVEDTQCFKIQFDLSAKISLKRNELPAATDYDLHEEV